jgi:hypothetical protein
VQPIIGFQWTDGTFLRQVNGTASSSSVVVAMADLRIILASSGEAVHFAVYVPAITVKFKR